MPAEARRVCLRVVSIVMAVGLGVSAAHGQESAPTDAPAAPAAKPLTAREKAAAEKKAAEEKTPIFIEGETDEQVMGRIAAAAAQAGKRNKRVLLVWGRNSSRWSRLLDKRLSQDPVVSSKLNAEYVPVYVDVGEKGEEHAALAQIYNADLKTHGVPYISILDTSLMPLGGSASEPLENAYQGMNPGYSTNELMKLMMAHETARVDARSAVEGAYARAKSEEKSVLLYFRESGCWWCDRLEDWLEREDVRPLLEKDLVIVGIDASRMKHGPEVWEETVGGLAESMPWMLMTDADRKPLATSNMPSEDSLTGTRSIGFPQAEEERTHLGSMLSKVKKRLTDDEIKSLAETLKPKK